MASSTAATNSPLSSAPSANVDELRGVLASKGLVVKESILARLARSKSFKETLTLSQDSHQLESAVQSAENGAQDQNEESGFETSVMEEPKQVEAPKLNPESVQNTNDVPHTSTGNAKEDGVLSSVTSEDGRVLALGDALLHSGSEEEKKHRRTERFGTISDDEKLKQRAARFGITQDVIEEVEKKRARTARFGIVDEDAKKKARLERFKESEPEDKEELERRKARALRFASSTGQSLPESKEM